MKSVYIFISNIPCHELESLAFLIIVWTVLMVNLEEEDYQGDIYKIAGNGYAACIITGFLRCLAALHSGYVSRDDICSWNMTFAWINLKLKIESFFPVRVHKT